MSTIIILPDSSKTRTRYNFIILKGMFCYLNGNFWMFWQNRDDFKKHWGWWSLKYVIVYFSFCFELIWWVVIRIFIAFCHEIGWKNTIRSKFLFYVQVPKKKQIYIGTKSKNIRLEEWNLKSNETKQNEIITWFFGLNSII